MKIVIANWKMNVPDLAEWHNFPAFQKAEIVICPPFSHLETVKENIPNVKLGAQDVFWEERGAFTGEVSPKLLKEIGVEYVIVGHSERRAMGESDEMISKKLSASLKDGLKVILCVGETKEIYEEGEEAAKEFTKKQLSLIPESIVPDSLIIAYEPVWAISTSQNAEADNPEHALKMIQFIKSVQPIEARYIYGGSVNSGNAQGFLSLPEIEGALVGGASLKVEEFIKIIQVAS